MAWKLNCCCLLMTQLPFCLIPKKLFFNLLDDFEKVSWLKLNVEKTEAMWIGSFNDRVDMP